MAVFVSHLVRGAFKSYCRPYCARGFHAVAVAFNSIGVIIFIKYIYSDRPLRYAVAEISVCAMDCAQTKKYH